MSKFLPSLKKGTRMPKISRKSKSKKLSDDIHLFLADNDFENAIKVLRSGMGATQIVRKSRKNGERGVS